MAVDDLWFLAKRDQDGQRQKSKRHGRGKRYRVRYVDDTGSPRERLFERKADAERFDAATRADISRGQYIDDRHGRMTVADLAEQWRTVSLHGDTTTVLVEHRMRLHILPMLGRMKIGQVRSSHIQAWVRDRSAVLATSTLRATYVYLTAIFAMAVRDRLIAATPCDGIRLPESDRGHRLIPSPEQVHQLADLLPRHQAAMVYVAAGCGLRLGEVLGLEVADVDFLRRELHVRRQLKVLTGRRPFLAPLKTKTSYRTVELPDVVGLALAKHLESASAPVLVDDDTDPRKPVRRAAALVFRGLAGDPVNAATFSRTWSTARAKVGLPDRWGFHGLRHYYATLLIHGGANVKTVQLALGHSTPTVTLNTYVSEWPDVVDRTRFLVDNALAVRTTAATLASSQT